MLQIMAKRYSLQHSKEVGEGKEPMPQKGTPVQRHADFGKILESIASLLGSPLQTACTSRFLACLSISASLLHPVPQGFALRDEINPPADESLMCSPSQRYLQRQQRLSESPKPSRSNVKHNRFQGEKFWA